MLPFFILIVPAAAGTVMLAESGDEWFGGLEAMGGLLWIAVSISALCGYALAWLLFFLRKKGIRRRN